MVSICTYYDFVIQSYMYSKIFTFDLYTNIKNRNLTCPNDESEEDERNEQNLHLVEYLVNLKYGNYLMQI